MHDYDSSDGSSPEDEAFTPSKNAMKAKPLKAPFTSKSRRQKSITLSDSEDEDDLSLPPLKKQHSTPTNRVRPVVKIPNGSSKDIVELSDDSDDQIITTSSPKKNQKAAVPQAFEEEEDSDEEPIASSLKKITVVESESESDIIPSPLKRGRIVDSDSGSDVVSSPMKRRKMLTNVDEEEDSDSDSSLPSPKVTLKSRREAPGSPPSSRMTRQQKAPKRHRSQKEKTLELMKRRRAGEKISQLTDTESDSEDEHRAKGIYDTDDEHEALEDFEDEEEDEEPTLIVEKSKGKKKAKSKSLDEYDSDFVVDEEDGPLGMTPS